MTEIPFSDGKVVMSHGKVGECGHCGFCPCTARAVVEGGTVVRVEWSCDGGETWGTGGEGENQVDFYGYYDCSRCICDDFGPTSEDPTVLELPGGAIIHLLNATSTNEDGDCEGLVLATVVAGGSGYTDGTFPIPYPHRDAECPCEGTGPGTCCDHCSNPRCYAQDCDNIEAYPPALQLRVKMNANFFRLAHHYDANPEFFDDEEMPPNLEIVCALACGSVGQEPCENGRCVGAFAVLIERDPQTAASVYEECFLASPERLLFTITWGTHQVFGDWISLAEKCDEECNTTVYSNQDELGRMRRCWFWMRPEFSYTSRSYACQDTTCTNPSTGLPYTQHSTMPDQAIDVYSYAQCMTRDTGGCPLNCKLPLAHIASSYHTPSEACYDDCTAECGDQGIHPEIGEPRCDYFCKQDRAADLLDSAYGIWIEPYETGTVCCASSNMPGFDVGTILADSFSETVTSVSFTPGTMAADAPAGTSAGTLSANVTATWRLACGPGDDDNAKFRIDGTTVRSSSSLPAGTYSIRVRAKASNRATREQSFTVTVS